MTEFRKRTLNEELYDQFFEKIWSKVNMREHFIDSKIDRGIYFSKAIDISQNLVQELPLSINEPQYFYQQSAGNYPFVLIVMNEPGKINLKENLRVDISKAYKFHAEYNPTPLYVLCEDEHSLEKNEFLKSH